MDLALFLNSELYTWFILPLLIFLARVTDVTLGTIRVIFISRGLKAFASVLGFIEVSIWLMAIRQILVNLHGPAPFFAYALGFAVGNYVGVFVESKISIGSAVVRMITKEDTLHLLDELKKSRHIITCTEADSHDGRVKVIFIIAKRSELNTVVKMIQSFDPKAYYSVSDVRFAKDDEQEAKTRWYQRSFLKWMSFKK